MISSFKHFILCLIFILIAINYSQAKETSHIAKKDYEVISFQQLYFNYHPPKDVILPDDKIAKGIGKVLPIPSSIQRLNNKKIALTGYILALDDHNGLQTFILNEAIRDCIYCAGLGFDQWLLCKTTKPKGFNINTNIWQEYPITFYGTLKIGPFYEHEKFKCLYKFEADSFEKISQ